LRRLPRGEAEVDLGQGAERGAQREMRAHPVGGKVEAEPDHRHRARGAGVQRDLAHDEAFGEAFGLARVDAVEDRRDAGGKGWPGREGEDLQRRPRQMQGRGAVGGAAAGRCRRVGGQAKADVPGATRDRGAGRRRQVQPGGAGQGTDELEAEGQAGKPRHERGQHVGCPDMGAVALQLEAEPFGPRPHRRVTRWPGVSFGRKASA